MITSPTNMPSYSLITKLILRNQQGEILTMQRGKDAPRRPWTWDFPGGVVESGEQPSATAVREAEEESGLVFSPSDLSLVDVVVHTSGNELTAIVFYAALYGGEEVVLSYEHESYKWVTPKEFAKLETPEAFKEAVNKL